MGEVLRGLMVADARDREGRMMGWSRRRRDCRGIDDKRRVGSEGGEGDGGSRCRRDDGNREVRQLGPSWFRKCWRLRGDGGLDTWTELTVLFLGSRDDIGVKANRRRDGNSRSWEKTPALETGGLDFEL